MKFLHPNTTLLFKQMGMILGLFFISRCLFFSINQAYFQDVQLSDFLRFSFYSLRFDFSTLGILNGLYLAMLILPVSWSVSTTWIKAWQFWFLPVNGIALLFDLADIGYFPYVRKRMTSEVFHLIGTKSDFLDLLPSYLLQFWYVVLAIVVIIVLLFRFNQFLIRKKGASDKLPFRIAFLFQWLLTLSLCFLMIRGGFQLRPIQTSTALLYCSSNQVPLVVNTPFQIIHSFEQHRLSRMNDYPPDKLTQLFNPIRNYSGAARMRKDNVVVIILESFGKAYTGLGGRTSCTPFLDSLMQKSLVFNRAFSNAYSSADGVPAVLMGWPHLIPESWMYSPYADNSFESISSLLRRQGYSTAFFHGGSNGTMNFDAFALSAGYQKYVGRKEYGNDADYDGTWGIWDGPFLQFTAAQLSKLKAPFHASIFTLSSHEPFKLPASFNDSAIHAAKGIERGIRYTDRCLKAFFDAVSETDWFANTWFVLTADHPFLATQDKQGYYNTNMGLYSIPVVFFHPSHAESGRVISTVFQQIDILPTLMDLMNYPDSFYALGSSGLDSNRQAWAFNQLDQHIQFLSDNLILTYEDTSFQSYFNFESDSLMHFPLKEQDSLFNRVRLQYQAIRQTMINDLIDNRHSIKTRQQLN